MENITKKVTITLPEQLIREAKERAFQQGQTFSGMIRTQIKGLLSHEK